MKNLTVTFAFGSVSVAFKSGSSETAASSLDFSFGSLTGSGPEIDIISATSRYFRIANTLWLCYQPRNIEIMSSACGPTVKFAKKVNSMSANSLGDIPKFYEGNILLYSDFIRDRLRIEFAGCIILNHVSE